MTAIVRTAMNIIISMMDMAGRTLCAYLLVSGEAQTDFDELVSMFLRGFG